MGHGPNYVSVLAGIIATSAINTSWRVRLLRAIELGPNLARGHYVYSHWFLTQKLYEEASREARLALDIDPPSMPFSHQLGMVHYFSRHYDKAIEQFRETSELNPLSGSGHQFLGFAYAQECMWKEAKEEIENGLNRTGYGRPSAASNFAPVHDDPAHNERHVYV